MKNVPMEHGEIRKDYAGLPGQSHHSHIPLPLPTYFLLALSHKMAQNTSHREVEYSSSTADSSYTTSATTYTTFNERSPLFSYPECAPATREIPEEADDADEERKRDNNKIPDGGLVAWTQVLTGHLVVFNVWGYITS